MKILWRKPIIAENEEADVSPYDFYIKPFVKADRAVYFYKGFTAAEEGEPLDYNVYASVFNLKSGEAEKYSLKVDDGSLPIPAYWLISEQNGGYLIEPFKYDYDPNAFCLFFNGKTIDISGVKTEHVKKIYPENREYVFGNLRVRIAEKSYRKLECTDINTGERVWVFKFYAYLYTDIVLLNGEIFFGTAGNGGHFYGLSLADGTVKHDINTHGTSSFTLFNGRFYFPSEKGDLQEYNPATGETDILNLEKNEFINSEVQMYVADGKLYAVAYNIAGGQRYAYSLVCVGLD